MIYIDIGYKTAKRQALKLRKPHRSNELSLLMHWGKNLLVR